MPKRSATVAPRPVAELLRHLTDGDEWQRRTALRELAVLGAPETLPALMTALHSPDCLPHGDVARAIGAVGGPDAVAALILAMGADDQRPRPGWLDGLVASGPCALEPLVAALDDQVVERRRNAARALSRLADDRAVVPLRRLFARVRGPDDRAVLAAALAACGYEPSTHERALTVWMLVTRGRTGDLAARGPAALPTLLQALRCTERRIQGTAAEALGAVGDHRATDSAQRQAAAALGRLGGPEASQALLRAFRSDRDEDVRRAAAEALGRTGEPLDRALAVATLVAQRRGDELTALGTDAVAPLLDILGSTDEARTLRFVLTVLGRLGAADAATPVAECLVRMGLRDVEGCPTLLLTEPSARDELIADLTPLFGDITPLLVTAACYAPVTVTDTGRSGIEDSTHRYDISAMTDAVAALCRLPDAVATDLLRLVAERPDPTVVVEYFANEWTCASTCGPLDLGEPRRLAAAELTRRGGR